MATESRDGEPQYSARLMLPWIAALKKYPQVPASVIEELEATDFDSRMPARGMVDMAGVAATVTGDPDIGLKAAQAGELGDYDVLEYAASSASTVRESADILLRYLGLVNDGLDVWVEVEGPLARCRVRSEVELNRQAADFQIAAFYVGAKRALGDALVVHEIWHKHAAPADLSGYRALYGDTVVRFGEPAEGGVYDAAVLDMPLPTADAKLHSVLRRHADQLLEALPKVKTTSSRVREVIVATLRSGKVSAESVAAQLHMSRRTLTRRLEEEHTTYKELLDEVRHQLAVSYLTESAMGVGEVAFLLGFSQGPAFHRAFKRWTHKTPIEYRNERR